MVLFIQFLTCESRKERKGDYGRATVCCVYWALIDWSISRDRRICAVYCLSDSKNNLVASGDIAEY